MERILAQNLLVRRGDRGRLCRLIILYIIWESHPACTKRLRSIIPVPESAARLAQSGKPRESARAIRSFTTQITFGNQDASRHTLCPLLASHSPCIHFATISFATATTMPSAITTKKGASIFRDALSGCRTLLPNLFRQVSQASGWFNHPTFHHFSPQPRHAVRNP
jgi:hypothetical protein